MENIKRLNDALEYIEQNLKTEIDMNKINQIAGCSSYHFQRMFSFLAQISLHEYIKRRRLSLAAIDCIETNERLIDLAFKYGYQSYDSFSRAFISYHGVTPSRIRKDRVTLSIFPKLSFQLTVKGNQQMKVRILEKESFNLVGISKRVSIQFNGVNPDIMAIVSELTLEKIIQLKSINDKDPKGIVSASYNFSSTRMNESGECDHLIGVHTSLTQLDNYTVVNVPAYTWAVLEVIGPYPQTLQETWAKIYSEWLPSTDYETIEAPEIVWNESPDLTKEDYRSEIWLAIRKMK